MVNFISRAWANTTTAIIISQGTMVILTVFGGVFVPWNQIPIYWEWLQDMSIFTQAARAVTTHMNNYLDYSCVLTAAGVCTAFGKVFECDATPSDGLTCEVRGRTVQYVLSGSSKTDSPWIAFGYLVLIFVVSRLGMLILMYFPAEMLADRIRKFFSSGVQEQINDVQIKNRALEGRRHHYYLSLHHNVSKSTSAYLVDLKQRKIVLPSTDVYTAYLPRSHFLPYDFLLQLIEHSF
jgi:hypothetical protein